MPLSMLAFVAFIPLIYSLERDNPPRKPYLLIYVAFFIYHAGTNWWISSWQEHTDPYLLMSGIAVALIHPVFFLVPMALFRFVKFKFGRPTALWLFPAIWVSFEWLHSLGDMAYPWLTIGYTQIYNSYWIQIVDSGGVWMASFIIVTINMIFLNIIFKFREQTKRRVGRARFARPPGLLRSLFVVGLLLVIPMIYGFVRIEQFNHEELLHRNESKRFAIIQPSIDPWQKWQNSVVGQIRLHQRIQDSLRRCCGEIDCAVWSETAMPFVSLSFNAEHDFSFLQRWVDTSGISLLTGLSDYYFYKHGETVPPTARFVNGDTTKAYTAYNAAVIINPGIENPDELQIHRKMRLTPFAERVPYEELFYFARSWVEWGVGISSWGKGEIQKPLLIINDNDSIKIGTIICIESVYPDFARGFVEKGSEVLSVITNDAWYDNTVGPEQHYLIAAMRAIECRRYIVRCANTGVSGVITPTGESLVRARQYSREGIAAQVPLMNYKSLYVEYGDWLPVLSTLAVIIALISAYFLKRENKL
jgi:apolipoprotein N-acyltransferase